jgi:hypothetical protein
VAFRFGKGLSSESRKDVFAAAPCVGVARLRVLTTSAVEHACTPGRRVYPSVIAATMVGVGVRKGCNTECNAPPAPLTSHASFRPVMFELVDDDGADDDAAFDDLLPVSGNVGQIEDVIQYADDESADNGTGYGADAAG